MSEKETIASRLIRLNQIILGRSTYNLPNKYLAHRDGLLDVLFALYEECNVDYMRKDKHIAGFVDKFKGVMVELKSLRVNVKDFEVKKIIGRGHFGEVQVVREKATGDVYAMKTLRKEETLQQRNVAFYKEERDIMSQSTSHWLTKLQYAFQDSQNLYLIMEFHPGGDMLSLLEKYDNVLPEDMCQFYLAELVLAIHSLHSMGYVHRDIKPDNILIDRTGHIKLADFGSASKLNSQKQVTSCMPVGTPDYVAPEVLAAMNPGPASNRSYGVECDWWSLGIVTYEMVFGSTPFSDEKVLSTYNNIMNFKNSLQFPPEAAEVSKDLIQLIKELLEEASKRIGYSQLIDHPLFTDIDWNNINNIAPPYVPTVTSIDDTSNFDEFEPENRPYIGDLKGRKEFTGKNLPFVGFTYTTPIETAVQRISSSDDIGIMSPSSSFCEPSSTKKKEVSALQNKISVMAANEEFLKSEINKLKVNSETKDNEVVKIKHEKELLKQIIHEKTNEVQQLKQLLTYEREHRVITEQKATQVLRCMKSKQKQDAIRLRVKSLEINSGEVERYSIEEQLEDALARIDEYVKERTELLEDLEATKHMLLECQQKVNEKDANTSVLSSEGEKSKSFVHENSQYNDNVENNDASTSLPSSEKGKKQSFVCENSQCRSNVDNKKENSRNEKNENKSEMEGQDMKRLIFKLEKKNIQLEKDLDKVTSAKEKAEASIIELQNTISCLKDERTKLEKKISDLSKQNSVDEEKFATIINPLLELSLLSQNQGQSTIDLSSNNADSSKEDTFTEESSGFSDESPTSDQGEQNLPNLKDHAELNVDESDATVEKERSLPCLSIAPINNVDIPSVNKDSENSLPPERRVLQDVTNVQKMPECSVDISDLKQENDCLKSKIENLTTDLRKLRDDIKNKENLYSTFENQLKEKEAALNEAKLDLRISLRKEQQSESMTSSLRERNKELREKVKSLEDLISEKNKAENELKEKINHLESTLSEKTKEVTEKEKLFEIEKAKLQYTCEVSKDVTQKFAKSQDHYEEVVKQNMALIKEKEERSVTNCHLLEEIKNLKQQLAQKKTECAKFEKVNKLLKNECKEMDETLEDLQLIVEVKEATISELKDYQTQLKKELEDLQKAVNLSNADLKKAENEKNKLKTELNNLQETLNLSTAEMKKHSEKLRSHIEELTSEMDNNTELYEAEMQNVQDHLIHYKKIVEDLGTQNEKLLNDLISDSSKCKNYSERNMQLESQLCEIKEEAARHITQISSLKSSNLKLTQSLEDAIENNKQLKQYNEELFNDLESLKVNHLHEKVKLQETVSQQTKLIDFLQSKTENMERRKKPHIARLFGKKETSNQLIPYRDVEKLLEAEKGRCRRLQDQLSQSRAEIVSLQREIANIKNSAVNVEVPLSPVSRAMHCVITQSPTADIDSPVLVSKELVSKYSKPPGMKHKIPHRFTNIMCMRSTKCCACLDSLHFGRTVAKCQECSTVCHPTCAASVPSTCGLPIGFMQHFKTAINSCSSNAVEHCENRLSEGWIKVPKNNKLGWDRRYVRLVDNLFCLYENSEDDFDKALVKLDFSPEVARIVVASAVSATELTFAAPSDLPFVLKLEYLPHTTCWPQRCLYIMTSSFSDKQMWVSTLEALSQENTAEIDGHQKNKLVKKVIWTLKGDRLIDPLCTFILNDAVILLGAVDGLYVLKIVNKYTCSLKSKIDSLQYIYQIACLESIGLMILIQGNERRLTMTNLSSVHSAVQKVGNSSLVSTPLADISECHLFSVDETYHSEKPYLCIATSKSVMLYQWDSVLKTFCKKKVFETKEPCSCIYYTPYSIICGTDSFYELDLKDYSFKKFLDDQDASLAGIIYGASQFRSFPIAIFKVSSSDEPTEYLMCFHEMGVFVNGKGKRTRPEDMKWSRLPLSFAYQLPYLFVLHFNSIEVIEIPPPNATETGLRAVTLIKTPQYLGPAHLEQSVYLSSSHDQVIELIVIEGKSIGRSEFNLQEVDDLNTESCSPSSSGKESGTDMDELDFSFSTSIDQSLAETSVDHLSIASKTSSDSGSSQS